MHRFSIGEKEFVEDLLSRRHTDYYSWMIDEVDEKGGLLTLGRMAIIGGQHAAGKSTYITELAKFNSKSKKTMLIPIEMGSDFTIMMLACNAFNHLRTGTMDMLQYGELEEGFFYKRPKEDIKLFESCVADLYSSYPNLHIKTPRNNAFQELKDLILDAYVEHDIHFFIIDHIHQLDSSENDSETAFYSMVAKELKELAAMLNISLLCVVQLTKAANGAGGTLDLSAFKGTSEFTSNAHRAVIIKKPNQLNLKDSDVKKMMKAEGQEPTPMLIEVYKEKYQREFEQTTRNVRELVFLKTRGRPGGTVTIRMDKGQFVFENHGHYIQK